MKVLYSYFENVDYVSQLCSRILIVISYCIVILTFPFSMIFCLKIVSEYERAVFFRLGQIQRDKTSIGPGLVFLLPCLDEVHKIDLRTISIDIPPQEILTKDSVAVFVDAVVYYRVCQPELAIMNVREVYKSTHILAQTTLRNVLGTLSLGSILTERDRIAILIQEQLVVSVSEWGVMIESVEIKDVRLPQQLQRVMAVEAEATRESSARVIAAEGERKSAINLKLAADQLELEPLSIHLRYLQTLNRVASSDNCSVYVLPFPTLDDEDDEEKDDKQESTSVPKDKIEKENKKKANINMTLFYSCKDYQEEN